MRVVVTATFVVFSVLAISGGVTAQEQAPAGVQSKIDERPVFDFRSLKIRGFVVESRGVIPEWPSVEVVLLANQIPEGEPFGLNKISRLFILEGDRIEFDSFIWDGVEDGIAPSVNSSTFFNLAWRLDKLGRSKSVHLIVTGTVPLQKAGEPPKTANRTLVITKENSGLELVADIVGRSSATVKGAEVKLTL